MELIMSDGCCTNCGEIGNWCKCDDYVEDGVTIKDSDSTMISIDQYNNDIGARDKVIVDLLKIVERTRTEINIKSMQSTVNRDFAQIGACEILSRVLAKIYNKMKDRIEELTNKNE